MNMKTTGSAVRIEGHPILRILVSFPIAFFSGALMTDIAYALTADMIWADFSAWLLVAGMVFGALAAIVGIIDLLANRHMRTHRRVWPVAIGSLLVLVLGLFDNLFHSRDAWTSVVPAGLILSAATVVVTLITAWFGSASAHRSDGEAQYSAQYSGARQ
jgi:uncharacterized membrane protein